MSMHVDRHVQHTYVRTYSSRHRCRHTPFVGGTSRSRCAVFPGAERHLPTDDQPGALLAGSSPLVVTHMCDGAASGALRGRVGRRADTPAGGATNPCGCAGIRLKAIEGHKQQQQQQLRCATRTAATRVGSRGCRGG
eukprot:GHVU01072356.1.p3 GENE.GHVU01072356.1~~GHVU01072356.1.p3  ORF type:complete len:137 (+),score=6.54 GHVU01072356.1:464-874(+)